jgi:hypothetical protein
LDRSRFREFRTTVGFVADLSPPVTKLGMAETLEKMRAVSNIVIANSTDLEFV